MTINEAIKQVLANQPNGMTSHDIYNEIMKRNLYTFGSVTPVAVVNSVIRRRCKGLDFPSAYPVKIFEIVGYDGKKPLFAMSSNIVSTKPQTHKVGTTTDQLPEEVISTAFKKHLKSIQSQVFDLILSNSPAFFEHLVIDLLLKMGYGYDKDSGIVTGLSHDGGIDGIINEDKLGLDKIYVQAKRYGINQSVGRKELQAFVGAMEGVNKGVFITTSHFTKEAKDFIGRQQKNIKLIDGLLLADLLVKYQIGITTVQTIAIYRIDSDYYSE